MICERLQPIVDVPLALGGYVLRKIGNAINPWPVNMEDFQAFLVEVGQEYEQQYKEIEI